MNIIFTLGHSIKDVNKIPAILYERLSETLKLFDSIDNSTIIVSGKNSSSHLPKTQAEIMKEWLVSKDIPEDKIIEDRESINTMEQILYINDYLKKNNDIKKVFIIATEGGFQKRVFFLVSQIISDNSNIEIIGAHLPSDITKEEKESYADQEKKFQILKAVIEQLKKESPTIDLYKNIAEFYRTMDFKVIKDAGYNISPEEIQKIIDEYYT